MTPLEEQQFQVCLTKVHAHEMSIANLLYRMDVIERKHREHANHVKSFLDDGR